MTLLGSSARRIRSELATAPDAALSRIVAMLDALESRGDADDMLAGIRPRLRRLRPARPMRFARLLALPLEGALIDPKAWKRAPWEIPRSALAPLLRSVRSVLENEAADIEAACAGRDMDDVVTVERLGFQLWRRAGALSISAHSIDWAQAGLPADAKEPVTRLATALWRHGGALFSARQAAAHGHAEPILRAALEPLASEGAGVVAAGALFVLRDAAAPAHVAWLTGELAPPVVRVALRAVSEALTEHSDAVGSAQGTGEMADSAEALLHRLNDADEYDPLFDREARRQERLDLRRKAAAKCVSRFATNLQTEVVQRAQAMTQQPSRVPDADARALEASVRNLRRLERAGRQLGEAQGFDRAIDSATNALLRLPDEGEGLSRMDLARLVEIIGGTDTALKLLWQSPSR